MNTDIGILVDKSVPWDNNKVKLLEQVIMSFYSNPANANQVGQILVQLKEDPDMWQAADTILEIATDPYTKFFALQALEQVIETKWRILPEDQKNAIKNYIVTMVVKMGASRNDKAVQFVLSKANMLLIGIIKQEWNTTWKNFIPDICESSKQDQNVCENNLEILRILSEEIFDYSKNKMTSSQIKELKETMHNEFSSIYQLCYFVIKGYLDNPQQVRISLIETCLNTLHAFLSWIPLGYIFLTDLIDVLLQLFDNKDLKQSCLKCLMEVVVLEVDGSCSEEEGRNIKQKLFALYSNFTMKLTNFIPSEVSLLQERTRLVGQKSHSLTHFDNFCQQLALFLSGFMKTHLRWIEPIANDNSSPDQGMTIDLIKKGFQYLVHLTELPNQVFKICIDFWNDFTASLLSKTDKASMGFTNEPLLLLSSNSNMTLSNTVFNFALIQIRGIVISKMAKPVEALLVIDETGRPVKQLIKNTETNSLYDIMKELMINLAKLDWENTKSIMVSKLDNQLNGSEWSFDNLNSLCWAVGSINGTAAISDEKQFLIYIIRGLLNLCEQKKGKENKAVVASDIMYVVGQYPRFLKSNWNFLKTVVRKLFEFMHETYPGVMEMAVNTVLKIAESCKEEFVMVHAKQNEIQNQAENVPYIDELIRRIPDETNMLEPEHKIVFYEAIGHMISAEPNFDRKQYLLQGVLQDYWTVWDTMLREIEMNFESLRDEKNIENFRFIIRVHERLAYSVGVDFYKALARIYMDLLKLYVLYSRLISNEINNSPNPQYALNHYVIKKIRAVKKEVLNLMITVIDKSNNNTIIAENFITPLLEVLQDYCNNVPDARESEVLALFTTIIEKLQGNVAQLVPQILQFVFEATLNMITTDFNSNIDHRVNLFKLLLAIAGNCFQALFNIPPEQFKTVIDCIIWAIKHELPTIFDSGLEALILILENVNRDQNIANQFYQCYYMNLLQDVLFVITDGLHKGGFKQQVVLLGMLFQVVFTDYITVPLTQDQTITNKEFVYQYIVDQLSKNFTTLSKNQTGQYIAELFNVCTDINQFKILMRDYLIKLSQYDPEATEEGAQMQNVETA